MTTDGGGSRASRIRETLTEAANAYAHPRRLHGENSFRLACKVSFADDEPDDLDPGLPTHLREFWAVCQEATLFLDVDYGQWGLRLFGAATSATETLKCREWMTNGLLDGDVVIGEFLGDLELLVCDVQGAGQLLVSQPLDPRTSWHRVGSTMAEFLRMYVDNAGEKFWVRRDQT
jgi:hypothetical protein